MTMTLTKTEAIALFDTPERKANASDLARALGVTPQYIWKWPEQLTRKQHDWVIGAAYRLGVLAA